MKSKKKRIGFDYWKKTNGKGYGEEDGFGDELIVFVKIIIVINLIKNKFYVFQFFKFYVKNEKKKYRLNGDVAIFWLEKIFWTNGV